MLEVSTTVEWELPSNQPYSPNKLKLNAFSPLITQSASSPVSSSLTLDENKIFFVNDRMINRSDRDPETKVFTSEEPVLEGDVQYIGGRHEMNYAIVN